MPRTLRISSRPTRLALTRFLKDLAKADLSGLKERARPNGITSTPQEWQRQLRTTLSEIQEWCPTGPFMFDLPPKTRRRRTGRRRR